MTEIVEVSAWHRLNSFNNSINEMTSHVGFYQIYVDES